MGVAVIREPRPILWNDSPAGDRSTAVGKRNSVSRVWEAEVFKSAGGFTWGVRFMNKAWQFLNGSDVAETMDAGKAAIQERVDRFSKLEFWV